MLLILANYILNGRLFGGVDLVAGGPPSFVFDIYNAVSVVTVLFVFSFIPFKNNFTKSITAFTIASAISNFVPAIALPYLYSTVDASSENYRSFLLIATTGFLQMILVQGLLTILLEVFLNLELHARTLRLNKQS